MKPRIGITGSTIDCPDLPGVPRLGVPEDYIACTATAGGLPFALPNVEPEPGLAAAYLDGLHGLLLSGGWDVVPASYGHEPNPKIGVVNEVRDRLELALVEEATTRGLPIFAICRGVQVLNVARGGTLYQDVPSQVEGGLGHEQRTIRWQDLWHGLTIVEGTQLARIAGRTSAQVNSFHHQAADRIGDGLVVTARAPDGVVEGLEDPAHPFCVGVQWHPERRQDDPLTQGLFSAFVAAARERTASHLRS